jgi:hypothetical protein
MIIMKIRKCKRPSIMQCNNRSLQELQGRMVGKKRGQEMIVRVVEIRERVIRVVVNKVVVRGIEHLYLLM